MHGRAVICNYRGPSHMGSMVRSQISSNPLSYSYIYVSRKGGMSSCGSGMDAMAMPSTYHAVPTCRTYPPTVQQKKNSPIQNAIFQPYVENSPKIKPVK